MTRVHDVAIIGGGPAGATAAALLAQRGLNTVVLEREAFPRFHIGESLLPFGLPIHERVGVTLDEETAVYKRGAQFVCETSGRVATFDFADALPGPPRHAWHVARAEFDAQLLRSAEVAGATVRTTRVRDVSFGNDDVRLDTDDGAVRAQFLVDASGQGRFLARKKRSIRPYRHFGMSAVFAHFDGITDDGLATIGEGNDIRIVVVPDGWAWTIPLPGQRLSVGLVSRRKGLGPAAFDEWLAGSELVGRMTAGATRSELRQVGNFSFRNTTAFGSRFACIGDAACFIDPVFSSGVCLGMNGAALMADRLIDGFAWGDIAEEELMTPVSEKLAIAYDTFCSMVYRFYNTKFVDNLIFGAPDGGELKPAVTSVLAGDVWRPDNLFRDMLLRARSQPWQEAEPVSQTAV